jgi:hypothetical protein
MIEKKHRQFFVILMIVYFATLSYIVEKSSEDCNVSNYWQILYCSTEIEKQRAAIMMLIVCCGKKGEIGSFKSEFSMLN